MPASCPMGERQTTSPWVASRRQHLCGTTRSPAPRLRAEPCAPPCQESPHARGCVDGGHGGNEAPLKAPVREPSLGPGN
eukprot:8906246-Lingulodinium_polyedra.AAC.1